MTARSDGRGDRPALVLDRCTITVLSAPVDEPVLMSFSQLGSRDVVVVELEAEGHVGLGESWVNYPSWAAVERVATLEQGVVPLLVGLDVSDPARVHDLLVESLVRVARQWGAPGPVWQAISAVDTALWDLVARVRGVPVATLLGGGATRTVVPAYASGVGPTDVDGFCSRAAEQGIRTVKARVGFGREQDERILTQARTALGDDVELCADANQAWTPDEALDFCRWSAPLRLGWLEEPVAGNRVEDLAQLHDATGAALACGENVYGAAEFARYVDSGAVRMIQPDLAKSGGFTMASRLATSLPPTVLLSPHCYGGAVVNVASVHLAAAFDLVPYVELDVRPNPLRDRLLTVPVVARDGHLPVPSGPGLGVDLDRDVMDHYLVNRTECVLRALV